MCGIISVKNLVDDKPVNHLVKFLYFNQKERGQEGYGFVGLNASRLDTYRATTEAGFLGFLDAYPYDEVILHHRLPTSTENTIAATHPFVLKRHGKVYYFLHNGVIGNSAELQARHARRGLPYASLDVRQQSFNDSEALAWEFILWLTGEEKSVRAQGSAAFLCLEVEGKSNKAQRLYFYRNASAALRVYRDKTVLVVTSEGNWGLPVKPGKVWYYDYASRKIKASRELAIAESRLWLPTPYQASVHGASSEWQTASLKRELAELSCERDYLICGGDYREAEELQDEIDYLSYELAGLEFEEARFDF